MPAHLARAGCANRTSSGSPKGAAKIGIFYLQKPEKLKNIGFFWARAAAKTT